MSEEMKKRVDQGASLMDSVGNIAGAIKWGAIAIVTVTVVGTGAWAIKKFTDIGGMVIDAGAAVYEAGAEGAGAAIEGVGVGAAVVRESVGNAVGTAMEGVDTEAVGESVTEGVDTATGWLADRVNNARDALSGDEEASTDSDEPAETE